MQPTPGSTYDDFEEFIFIEQPPTAAERFAAILKKEPIVDKTISSEQVF